MRYLLSIILLLFVWFQWTYSSVNMSCGNEYEPVCGIFNDKSKTFKNYCEIKLLNSYKIYDWKCRNKEDLNNPYMWKVDRFINKVSKIWDNIPRDKYINMLGLLETQLDDIYIKKVFRNRSSDEYILNVIRYFKERLAITYLEKRDDNSEFAKIDYSYFDVINKWLASDIKSLWIQKFVWWLWRNLKEYFHVRFQLEMVLLSEYAVNKEDEDILDATVKSIEYSFKYQKNDWSFELVIPSNIHNKLSKWDLESWTAFFLSALSTTLNILHSSEWYSSHHDYVEKIEWYAQKFQLSLDYLKSKKILLGEYDKETPNRLLFDANAYYWMWDILWDDEAKDIGLTFMNNALDFQHKDGYYIEKDWYDSSYQAVWLVQWYILLPKLNNFYDVYRLRKSLLKWTLWLQTRIKSTWEVSTEWNSRVYDWGESFLWKKKQVDAKWVYSSFIYAYLYTWNIEYLETAKKVLEFYR